jgi:hypothetical protein
MRNSCGLCWIWSYARLKDCTVQIRASTAQVLSLYSMATQVFVLIHGTERT